ncbi:hypothetical protein EBZ37_10465, partial [bacterium]|nr:hypothetical protein [bacterium]
MFPEQNGRIIEVDVGMRQLQLLSLAGPIGFCEYSALSSWDSISTQISGSFGRGRHLTALVYGPGDAPQRVADDVSWQGLVSAFPPRAGTPCSTTVTCLWEGDLQTELYTCIEQTLAQQPPSLESLASFEKANSLLQADYRLKQLYVEQFMRMIDQTPQSSDLVTLYKNVPDSVKTDRIVTIDFEISLMQRTAGGIAPFIAWQKIQPVLERMGSEWCNAVLHTVPLYRCPGLSYRCLIALLRRPLEDVEEWRLILLQKPEWFKEMPKELRKSHALRQLAFTSFSSVAKAIYYLREQPRRQRTESQLRILLDCPFSADLDCASCFQAGCKCLRHSALDKDARQRGGSPLALEFLGMTQSSAETPGPSLSDQEEEEGWTFACEAAQQIVAKDQKSYQTIAAGLKEHPVFGLCLARSLLSAPQEDSDCGNCGIRLCEKAGCSNVAVQGPPKFRERIRCHRHGQGGDVVVRGSANARTAADLHRCYCNRHRQLPTLVQVGGGLPLL